MLQKFICCLNRLNKMLSAPNKFNKTSKPNLLYRKRLKAIPIRFEIFYSKQSKLFGNKGSFMKKKIFVVFKLAGSGNYFNLRQSNIFTFI